MQPLSPLFAINIYFIALVTAYLIQKKFPIKKEQNRFGSIDGLRGFLAIGVFIHHAAIWYSYLHTSIWELPKSNLYTHLGQTSVSFFFMITSFLFISKLLNTQAKNLHWNAFFISRIYRIVPVYWVSIFILVIIVLVSSNWEIQVPFFQLLKETFYWASFTLFNYPLINNSYLTYVINAGVVWSLPYEWLFYFSMPLIALLIFKKNNSTLYLILSLVYVASYSHFNGVSSHHILSFIGGAVAPFILKYYPQKVNWNHIIFGFIILACLSGILFFKTSDNYLCKLLIIVVFNLIALGNNFFGILKSASLQLLGDISYSTYLMHGFIIFIQLYFIVGFEQASIFSFTKYAWVIFSLTPILVLVSYLMYVFIEKPFMNIGKKKVQKMQKGKEIVV